MLAPTQTGLDQVIALALSSNFAADPKLSMRPIDGSTQGLRAQQTKRLQATFRRKIKDDALTTVELARHVCDISKEINRQVGVIIDRGGHVTNVIVGEPHRLYLPDIGRSRGGLGRLRGLRLLRTELRQQGLTREDIADLTKLRLDAVVVLEVDPAGNPQRAHWARLEVDPRNKSLHHVEETHKSFLHLPDHGMALVREAEADIAKTFAGDARDVTRDSAVLIGVWPNTRGVRKEAESSMAELAELARTAGGKSCRYGHSDPAAAGSEDRPRAR